MSDLQRFYVEWNFIDDHPYDEYNPYERLFTIEIGSKAELEFLLQSSKIQWENSNNDRLHLRIIGYDHRIYIPQKTEITFIIQSEQEFFENFKTKPIEESK